MAPSATQHGVREEGIPHAYRSPFRVWDLGQGFSMMVGAIAAANILEIGYVEAVALLRVAVQERSDAERHVLTAIQKAREAGMSWSSTGTFGLLYRHRRDGRWR